MGRIIDEKLKYVFKRKEIQYSHPNQILVCVNISM